MSAEPEPHQTMNWSKVYLLQKLALVSAWGLLAFIAYATFTPIVDRPTLPTSTSTEHITAFFVLGIAFCAAYPTRLRFVVLMVLGSAALLEGLQFLTPDRHGRIEDAFEKMAGGF